MVIVMDDRLSILEEKYKDLNRAVLLLTFSYVLLVILVLEVI
jgi:hypothetical protein